MVLVQARAFGADAVMLGRPIQYVLWYSSHVLVLVPAKALRADAVMLGQSVV